MNRKKDKKSLTFQSGDSNPRFPPMIWMFMEGMGDDSAGWRDQIKTSFLKRYDFTKVNYSWGLTVLICIYCGQSWAVTDAMAELRSENMIELVAIDLGVIITYGSCLEFAEQCYQKSLIFPCQNRKFIKWLNIELYIGIGQKKLQNMIELVTIVLEVIITYGSCLEFAEQCYEKSLICQNRRFVI